MMSDAAATIAELLNDSSIDRFMAIDTDWNIIAWNRSSEKLTGIQKIDIYGKKLLEVFPQFGEDKEMIDAIRLAMAGIKTFVPAQKDKFNRHHYENHFIPLTTPDGRMVGVMNLMHDVAHRIKAEQQLHKLNIALKKKYEQLERTADELATLTWITTHNIKEPLRQFYASLELLVRAEGRALSEGGKANARRMQASLNRMTLLLDDILALSGINTLTEEESRVDLEAILQQVLDKLKEKIRSGNVNVQSAGLPVITGYPEMLHYLFFYLINNAIKFRKHDAPLHITISSTQVTLPGNDTEVAIGADRTDTRIYTKISFVDDGTGFNQEDADRLFLTIDKEPQKYASSGAGLAICRKVVTAHEGFIQAEGWPGRGAAFHCYFPSLTEALA
jgi:PAS domain S-box-containing protein